MAHVTCTNEQGETLSGMLILPSKTHAETLVRLVIDENVDAMLGDDAGQATIDLPLEQFRSFVDEVIR